MGEGKDERRTVRVRIEGRVQGVGYRMSMYYAAVQCGVTGWVRNCQDGTVESMVQGPEENVNEFIELARKGPGMARVEQVEVSDGFGLFEEFEIKDTL